MSGIDLRRDGWCLHLTFNRPKVRNALNDAMWEEIERIFMEIRDDRSIRAVVLRGAGGYFCSGADLRERRDLVSQAQDEGDPLLGRSARSGRYLMMIDQAPQIVISAVEGGALGGGFGLVCASDIALSTADAKYGLPEVTLGIPPAQIMPYLLRRIGPAEVRRLALTAARFDGREAARIGVVNEVFDSRALLDTRLGQILAQIDNCAAGAIAASKVLLHGLVSIGAESYVDRAAVSFAACARGQEGLEGAAAFKEKRKPSWRSQA
jgi:isohexenylglutaconyl-CoA hydratase